MIPHYRSLTWVALRTTAKVNKILEISANLNLLKHSNKVSLTCSKTEGLVLKGRKARAPTT